MAMISVLVPSNGRPSLGRPFAIPGVTAWMAQLDHAVKELTAASRTASSFLIHLGVALPDWAGLHAKDSNGAHWIRVDVWIT